MRRQFMPAVLLLVLGAVLPWTKGSSAPLLIGSLMIGSVMNGSFLPERSIRLSDLPGDFLSEGPAYTADISTCVLGAVSGVYEEFFVASLSVADLATGDKP